MHYRHQDARLDDVRAIPERRREPRGSAAGRVALKLAERGPTIDATLLDVSESGFRAAHDCPDLRAGIEVGYKHWRGSGRARIVWNRIVGGRFESGFFVLER
jgi:hypothetical protein